MYTKALLNSEYAKVKLLPLQSVKVERKVTGRIVAVCRSEQHTFSKVIKDSITLVQELGVEGDVHAGAKTRHRSAQDKDPDQTNLRQVHLMHKELIDELNAQQFNISPGALGENITTQGINLLALPANTKLLIGLTAIIQLTGLRESCTQLDQYRPGLKSAVLDQNEQGDMIYRAGVMGIILRGGRVRPGDEISVELPKQPWEPLKPL